MKNIEDTSLNYGSNIERFWRDFFRGFTAPVILPSLTSSDSLHLSRQTQEIRLSNSKTSDLTKFLKNNKLSLYTLIQGVMALLLSHYTRETDILFGSTTEKPDFNIVPVRVSVDPDASVLSWLRELQRQWSTLTECEFTPLEQIQQWSEIPLELPLFEMLVILGNYEKLECFEYPLILSVDAESDLLLKIDYKQTKFADDTIARMLGHLETLLTNIINLPEQTLADIPLLTETERHQLLVEWNQTEVDYLQDKCIHLLFEEQVENTPDAIAVVFENQQITYQELNESANQLANYLQKLGVNADKLVGLCLETSLARIVGLLGILKAGGVYLPLDPVYPQERLRFMIEDSQVSILVTQASLAAKLSENSLQVVSLDADWEKIATESTNNLQSCVTGENLAYVIYTSGSTGTPKGVLISHQAIAHHSQNIIEHYQLNSSDGGTSTSGDRILQFASLSFDVSLEQILPTLAVGATLILIDTKLLTLGEFHQKLIDYGLTVVNIPPAYFTQWLLFLTENAFTNVPNQLRLVICGGEALPVESLKIWQNSPLKRIRLINAYGPTETTITAITFTINQENTSIESYTNIPIGRPLPNRKVYILNQQKNLVPIGIAGELHIGGEGLAQGYLNQPKLTEDKFIFDPFDNTFCSLWESFANRGTSLTIAGRNRREIEGLIGFFVNTLALRTNVSHNPIFRELLNQVKQVCLEAYTNQDVPFEQLVEVLQPERNLSHTPIFQVMFVLQNAPLEELELPNLHLTALEPPKQTAKFDLTLSMAEKNGQLIGEWEYNTDLFDSSTIERMIEHFQVLLSGILATPEQNIWQLPLLTERERHQLLVEWNQTELDYPQDKCIHQLFEEQVKRTPDAVAVMFENEQLTYRELNQRANQLAHYLKSLGVGANVLVGLCMERDSIEEVSLTLDIIVGILGILKAGGAYLPLDPRYPTERLLLMLQDGQVPVLLTQKHLSARLPQHQVELICLDTDWLLISQSIESNPVCEIQPKNLAYAIYTSGSTGEPKGVMIQHSSVVNLANGLHQAIYSDHQNFPLRVSLNGSLTFDTSVKQIIQLIYGHSLNIVPEKVRFDGNAMLSYLQQQKIDVLDCTPSHLRLLIAAGLLESDAAPQYVLVGGEPIDESMWTTLAQAQNIKFYNVYGPTECTVDTTLCLIQIANIKPVIGRPIANVKTYILDEYLQPVPINIPGELHIGGAGLARGYVNAKELTQKKFISNPFDQAAESRLYKTGDLARYLPNGEIEYLGRIDNQVKIRGFRIELGEIEAVLNQHPNLKAAKVITREDIPGDKRLVAYIISKSNQNSPSEISHQLREYLKQKLPDYMIPSAFVVLESFPLTTNGKIDCRSLPAPNFADSGSNYVAPRTPTEEIIAHIWSQVLKIETIGIDDNFFELGGHSLLATQVISRIRQSFNLEIPLYLLFEFPTIAQISEQIGITKQTDDVLVAAITPRQQQENLPLSFAQQRLWFLDKLKPNSSAYNIAYRLKILGSLNINILEQSLYEIIQRHEILQTNFVVVNGQPTQVITHNFDFNLPIIDLQSLPDFQRETEAEKIAKQEAEKSLNLAEDTLFRIQLLRLSPEDNLLLINIHHIIFDGWSFRVLFEELKALYTAYCQDLTSPLRQLPIQYADFTLWQRQWLTGEVLESQLNYWKRQLGGTLPVLELPTDRPRPQVQTYAGATKFFIFSKELTASLKSLCQEEGVTLFMTLLTAFKILLCRYSGQKDVIVGTPIAGRNRREIEVLIGFFVNTLALRTDLGEHRSFRELLSRVRRVCLEAYTHQDVPFEQLVEVLQPERNLSHTPIFQVMFALQNALMGELQLPNLTVTALEALVQTAKFDLTLSMSERNGQLIGEWEYNTDLFDGSTIERMIQHFQMLLSGILAAPHQCIWELPLITEKEKHQLLIEWNQTQTDYHQDQCIHQLFEEQVERTPDAVAVVFEQVQLTYRELNKRANQLANYLQTLGVKAEVLVGICTERSLEMIVGILGILKAGGAYVPLDIVYPQERLAFMLSDSQVSILLTQQHLVEKLPEHQATVICLDTDSKAIELENQEKVSNGANPENLAYVMYTSGSTGQPKGVCVLHLGVVRLVKETNYANLSSEEVFLQLAPLAFDASTFEIWGSLLNGGRLVIFPAPIPTLEDLAASIHRYKITTLWLTAGLFHLMVDQRLEDLKPLRQLLAGGDVLSLATVQRVVEALDNCQVINGYGPTENTTFTCYYSMMRGMQFGSSVPIGRPIANTQVYILDQFLQPVPISVTGEIYVGGAGLARGYLNRPELTAERFISHPFNNQAKARLYKTGDLGRYLPNGEIEYLGRIDNQVKIRGFRIELGEIEAVLNQHPNLKAAKVITREDIPGDKRLVAYIISKSNQNSPSEISHQLREYLKQKLPDYMIPSAFVALESFPLTTNGKIDHRALPTVDFINFESKKNIQPSDNLELQLIKIWENVLRIQPIGLSDNFFDLGGYSLLALRLFAQINEIFGKNIPLAYLFQSPTIKQLAHVLRQEGCSTSWFSLVPIQTKGSKPPFYYIHTASGGLIHSLNLLSKLDADQPVYGLQAQGLDGKKSPHTCIEDMASHYIKEIQTVQPHGPYLLGGWCAGGVIAYEMAQQLYAQGETVELLTIFDAFPPKMILPSSEGVNFLSLVKTKSRVTKYTLYLMDMIQRNRRNFNNLTFQQQMIAIWEKINRRIQDRITETVYQFYVKRNLPLPHTLRHLAVRDAIVHAYKNYCPTVYPGQVIFFRAVDQSQEYARYLKRWEELAAGGLEIHDVPGNHDSIMAEPHVSVLAEKLRCFLQTSAANW
ncbi:amino acid adenylation domain-containing protein [Anabaena cylindrica PCC 7122]|nr:amino acid adenylation domain-containing protein [Anabaena cylindrica PCC 7122]